MTKSKFMIFGTQGQQKLLDGVAGTVDDHTLMGKVSKIKYLGVILDPSLNFHEHVNYLVSKTVGKLSSLDRMRAFVDHETSLMLFVYCDYVYDCLSQKDIKTLQKLQNCGLCQV